MASDSPTAAPSEGTPATAQPVDDLIRAAEQLTPDERLRLIARLWSNLPRDHRAALVTLQLNDTYTAHATTHTTEKQPQLPADFVVGPPSEPLWPQLYQWLFAPDNASGLYSAPRRFDLATIFVVTAAYSLLLGGLTAIGMPPLVKVVVAALVTIIAATQALFLKVANPRGISIITGAIAYTVMSWCIWLSVRYVFPNSFFFVTFINGIIGGAILGYLLGTLVGGIFLVADMLRGKFERRTQSRNTDSDAIPLPIDAPDQRAGPSPAP